MRDILLKGSVRATELLFAYGMSFLLIASLFVALAYSAAFAIGQPLSIAIHHSMSKYILPPIYISAILLSFVGIANLYLRGKKFFCLEIQTKKK